MLFMENDTGKAEEPLLAVQETKLNISVYKPLYKDIAS